MHFIHSTLSIRRCMSQSEENQSTASELCPDPVACQPLLRSTALRLQTASTVNLHPPTRPAALRGTFSRFCSPSRSTGRLRKATAAVGSEALHTTIRRSRFGARTIAGSNSASTQAAGSAGSRGPELRAPGERARLRLRRYAVLCLSSPEECRHRCPSV
jgi:hypothetical protein